MTNIIKCTLAAALFGICMEGPLSQAQANHRRGCCEQEPTKEVVLIVCHPCTECKHEVCVCIPACCQGVPTMCFEHTLIGAGKTVFEWSCGYRVVVRYNNHGGYRVVQR